MKIYVVTAGYCEETVVCGATPDYDAAVKIQWHEENNGGIKPDWVNIDDYDTDTYLPMNAGMKAYEVSMYPDGHEEVEIASLCGFESGRVGFFLHRGTKCFVCDVYAKDEESASRHAAEMRRTYIERKRIINQTNYISKPQQ